MENKKNIEPKQLDVFEDFGPQKNKEERTLEDIKNASKSLKPEVLNSIVFKDGKYLIEGIDADKWIKKDRKFNGEDSEDTEEDKSPWYNKI